MAKKPKDKAPDAEGPDRAPPSKGGRTKLLVGIGLAVLVAAGGGWFAFRGGEGARPAVAASKPVAFLDIREMTVNLASEPNQERPRFLKLKVSLEVKDPKIVSDVKPLLPRVEDIFQVFVRELRASDLEGSGGIHRLREELLRRVNLAVAPTKVDAVLFKEVTVQ